MATGDLFPHTENEASVHRLRCNSCGKGVSTGFVPLATDTPDRGLIERLHGARRAVVGATFIRSRDPFRVAMRSPSADS